MKRSITYLLVLMLLPGWAAAQGGEDPIEPDPLEKAMASAQERRKPVFVEFTAIWCGYCKQMRKETLSQESVVTALESMETVSLDIDRYPLIARRYGIRGVPAYLVLTPTGREATRLSGYSKTRPFLEWLWKSQEDLGVAIREQRQQVKFQREIQEMVQQGTTESIREGLETLLETPSWRDELYTHFADELLGEVAQTNPDMLMPWLKHSSLGTRIHVYHAIQDRLPPDTPYDPWDSQSLPNPDRVERPAAH